MNTESTDDSFQHSQRKDSFKEILNSSATMYETLGSQFFRTTTAIQSGPETFEESRLVMSFSNNLAVIGKLCSFRLV